MKGERGRIRSIRGPVVLITVGALFALQNFTQYDFGQTWPVILLVLGLLILLERTVGPPPPVAPPPPQYGWPQPQGWQQPPWQPPVDQAAPGGYRATNYAQGPNPPAGADAAPATGAATGGFGSSAQPKPDVSTESTTPGGGV